MRKGSHHFILYDFPEGGRTPAPGRIRDIYNPNGTPNFITLHEVEDQIFVFGTQFRETDYSLPEGVAIKVPAGKYYDMNSHYVNYGDAPVDVEVFVNRHTVEELEVDHIAEQLFLSKTNFTLFLHINVPLSLPIGLLMNEDMFSCSLLTLIKKWKNSEST